MKTAKREYLELCMKQSVSWLKMSASSPSKGMSKMHIAIHYIAIRNKTGLTVKSKAKTLQCLRKYADKLDL